MGGFFVLFHYLYFSSLVLLDNYAKRGFLAEKSPILSILIPVQKNQEKSQQKNHVKDYKQKKIKRAETNKKTTKKTKI